MVSKTVSGTRNGTVAWLLQRISAVLIVLLGGMLIVLYFRHAPFDHARWRAAFDTPWVAILTWLWAGNVALHAAIGLRDILIDYVRPVGLRLMLETVVGLALTGYLIWAARILWGSHGAA